MALSLLSDISNNSEAFVSKLNSDQSSDVQIDIGRSILARPVLSYIDAKKFA